MNKFLEQLGILRILLVSIAIIVTLAGIGADNVEVHHGWKIVPTVFLPALAPIVFFVILFDVMMCRIRMNDCEGSECLKFRFINRVYGIVLFCMLLSWVPFLISIAQRT